MAQHNAITAAARQRARRAPARRTPQGDGHGEPAGQRQAGVLLLLEAVGPAGRGFDVFPSHTRSGSYESAFDFKLLSREHSFTNE